MAREDTVVKIKTAEPPRTFRVPRDKLQKHRHFRALLAAKPRSDVIHEPNIKSDDFALIVEYLHDGTIHWHMLDGSDKTWRLGALCVAAHKLELPRMFTRLQSALITRATKTHEAAFLKAVAHVYGKGAATPEFRTALKTHAAVLFTPSSQEPATCVKEALKRGGHLAQDMYQCRGMAGRQTAKKLEARVAKLEARIAELDGRRRGARPAASIWDRW